MTRYLEVNDWPREPDTPLDSVFKYFDWALELYSPLRFSDVTQLVLVFSKLLVPIFDAAGGSNMNTWVFRITGQAKFVVLVHGTRVTLLALEERRGFGTRLATFNYDPDSDEMFTTHSSEKPDALTQRFTTVLREHGVLLSEDNAGLTQLERSVYLVQAFGEVLQAHMNQPNPSISPLVRHCATTAANIAATYANTGEIDVAAMRARVAVDSAADMGYIPSFIARSAVYALVIGFVVDQLGVDHVVAKPLVSTKYYTVGQENVCADGSRISHL